MTFTESEKADAELVGHIIIMAITIIGISMIALVGIPAIYSFQDMATVRNAEQTYTMLDSLASKVALGESSVQSIDIDLKGGSVSLIPNSSSQPSYILFEFTNGTSGITTPILVPMGKIMYRLGDRDVAYEGGGVWTKYPSGSVMLSPPEFNFNGVTLTFPIVNVSGNFSAGGKGTASLKIEKKNSIDNTKIIYPTAAYQQQNPLDQNITKIKITIKSEYYDAWEDYFRTTSLLNVDSTPSDKKVVVTLNSPPLVTNFSYGVLASDEIELGNGVETHSYNSSKGNHLISEGNGSIRAGKKIEMEHSSTKINGDAMTGGKIEGKGEITGDVWADEIDDGPGQIVHPRPKKDAVEDISMGNTVGLVQGKINEYKITNNSLFAPCITGSPETILNGGDPSPCTLSSGNYYISSFSLPNQYNLIFNTISGPVNIATDNKIKLGKQVNLTVVGDNPVRIYLSDEFEMGENVKINQNINDTSSLFQVISSSSQDIEFSTQTDFTGFIWAPYADVDEGGNNINIYGAIVAEKFEIDTGADVYFDEALQNLDTELSNGEILTYLYITQNEMVVSMN